MVEQNFIDHVRMYCRSGSGGAGSSHLRREKFNPHGGPDGGDGGRGGHVILKGNRNLWTLLHLRYRKHAHAGNGENGGTNQRTGKDGEDIILEVPLGTVAIDEESGEKIVEIMHDEEVKILLEGGKGGLGNVHFKSSTRQTPRYAQTGLPGIEKLIILELKLLADVGLVGFPNAGKSTLLSVLSAAKPKVASYPFTTLRPNLGVVSYRDQQSFVMADIPGIIEKAHEGKGLGLRFLRHIERNSLLLFMVPVDVDDINESYRILLNELRQHNPELMDKPKLLALSKSDMLDEELEEQMSETIEVQVPYCFISAMTGAGLTELKDLIWQNLTQDLTDA